MKRNLLLILACFAAGLTGANIQPILSGTGKLIFPEATPQAYLQSSSGALTVAAGGSNQSVIARATGTGGMTITGNPGTLPAPSNARSLQIAAADGAQAQVTIDTFGSNTLFSFRRSNGTVGSKSAIASGDPLWNINALGYGATGYGGQRARIVSSSAENWTDSAQGTTMTLSVTTPGTTTLVNPLLLSSTGVSVGGDADVSGVYRKGGTAGAGTGSSITVCTSGACATSCTLVFNGGIRTGGSCP